MGGSGVPSSIFICVNGGHRHLLIGNMNITHKSGLFGVSNYQRAKHPVTTDATGAVGLKHLKGK